MDEVRARQQEFVDREDQLRTMRLQRSESAGQAMTWTLLGLIGVFALTLLNETRSNLRNVDKEYAAILTDLRKRSAELSESRKRLPVTLSSIGDAVIVTDARGRITFLNPVAEKLTQHSLAQANGKDLDECSRS
jgi:PAS domain-containing protein